jgi:Uma2 family endonuclease
MTGIVGEDFAFRRARAIVAAVTDERLMSAHSETWPRPHRLTVDEYYRMAEVGLLSPDDRTELIEGEIVDMPPIGSGHAAAVTVLAKRMIHALGDSADVRIQFPVRFLPRSEPQPDIAVVRYRSDAYRKAHPTADDALLLVEVSDATLRYDLGVKARLYATHGILEYWVVDLVNRRVVRHRAPSGAQYTQVDEITAGSVALPVRKIEIDLSHLW